MPFHDGHLASAESSPWRRGALRSVGGFPWFDVDATQSSDTSVARRSFAPVPVFWAMPILRGVRTSLDRVLRTPVKGCGVETIRGAFLRLPARAIERRSLSRAPLLPEGHPIT